MALEKIAPPLWQRNLLFAVVCLAGAGAVVSNLLQSDAMTPPTGHRASHYNQAGFRTIVDLVDEEFAEEWKKKGVESVPLADDLILIRRLSLGLTGTIPSLQEIRALETQPSEERIQWWLSYLFEDRRMSDYLAERFARAYVGVENGPFIIYRRRRFVSWLADEFQANRPYDQIVRSLITAEGLWTNNPEVNFVTVTVDQNEEENDPDEMKLAARVTRAFLGVRIDCVQCHDDHLGDDWKQKDFHQLASFFAGTDMAISGIRETDKPYKKIYDPRKYLRLGEAGVVAAQARTRDGRLSYAYELARAYAGAEVADRRIGLAEDELEEAEADLKAARALVEAGKEARLRGLQAETEVNSLRAVVDTAKAERVGAYSRLTALSGQSVSYSTLAEPMLDRLAPMKGQGPIDPTQTAPYLAAKADAEAAARRVTSAKRQAIPDVTVSVGVRRLEVDNANALLAAVSVPFPLFDRNRGNIDAAQAELRGAQAREAATRLEAEAAIQASLALNEAADARAAAADRTLSTAEESYRLARIAYEAGKSPLIELLAARHGLGAARGVVLDARAAQFDARASLARLEGRTITGEPVQ